MASSADAANYQLLTITKNGKEVRLDGKTTSFDYYESLLSPNVTAIMTFVDTGGATKYDKEYDKQERLGTIYNALPLTGDGSEEVKFKIASGMGTLDFSRTPLYVNGAVNPDQESQRESVILSLVSKSAITNQETHVKKNYANRTNITDSVESIAKNILKLDKLRIDETSNKYPFIGNNKSPFDVILMLASKSVPKVGSPGFFFYETKDGHNFRSIDSLIDQEPVATYYKSETTKSSVNSNNDYKISLFSINKNQNLINALKSGVYSNRRVVFNPKTFKEEEIDFNLDVLKKALGKNEVPRPKDTKYTRVLYSVKDVGALSSEVKETDQGDVNSYQGAVQMRYNLLFTQVAKIQVPCNPKLKAGDVIKCNLEIITRDQKEQGVADPVESGKYLILDLCHHYDPERSFTAMTLVRDTYGLYTNKS
jgi:hypothetical protein